MNDPEHHQDDVDTALLADHERWYAAIGYMFILCFISLWKGKESDFARFHARQAFLLFIAECAGFLAILVVDAYDRRVRHQRRTAGLGSRHPPVRQGSDRSVPDSIDWSY